METSLPVVDAFSPETFISNITVFVDQNNNSRLVVSVNSVHLGPRSIVLFTSSDFKPALYVPYGLCIMN